MIITILISTCIMACLLAWFFYDSAKMRYGVGNLESVGEGRWKLTVVNSYGGKLNLVLTERELVMAAKRSQTE